MLSATHIGLYLLFLTLGILGGFLIGLATDKRRREDDEPAVLLPRSEALIARGGKGGVAGVNGGRGEPGEVASRPPAPEKPQWLRDAERGEADDIERMSAAPPPYYGGPHLTSGHRSH